MPRHVCWRRMIRWQFGWTTTNALILNKVSELPLILMNSWRFEYWWLSSGANFETEKALQMKLINAFFHSYLRVAIFYVLTMYLVTAPPTGPFVFRWTMANSGLTLSYLIFYPLLIYRFPNLKKRRFAFQSLSTRSLKRLIEEDHLWVRNWLSLFKARYCWFLDQCWLD